MNIYKITNTINQKIYIGQTVRPISVRFSQHIHEGLKKNSQCVLHKAIRKYGKDNFICESIYEASSTEELNIKEAEFISFYKSEYLSGHGYNMLPNGASRSGFKMSIKSSILKSIASSKAVICIDTEQEFKSIKAAAEHIGVTPGYLVNVLSGLKRTAKGLKFKYKNNTEANSKAEQKINKKQTKTMGLMVQNLNTGEVFPSIKKAAKAVGVAEINFRKHLDGRSRTCKGSIFKVIGEFYGSKISN